MARRKKGRAIHGWLVLDKPAGLTSTQALGAVKRLFDAQKAGHAGTLDPLATGILPIAFGEATKTVSFAVDGAKSYRFTVRWGEETTTDDAEGQTTSVSSARPSRFAIESLLPLFTGAILQVPPKFSAIKINGNRAYDLARGGEDVQLDARSVTIKNLRLAEFTDADTAVFEADCGKGTYVRSIARDMGRALNCYGHVIALRRTRAGPFAEERAITLDDVRAAAEDGAPDRMLCSLLPVEFALHGMPALMVNASDAADLVRGRAVLIRGRDAPVLSGPIYATHKGRLVALGEIDKGALHPTRVFNLSN